MTTPVASLQLAPPDLCAAEAGLRYVSDASVGIRRKRCGRGFRYVDPDGSTVTDPATRDRIAALAVPPAWTDVWICPDPRGHIQATGRDARGRKQYRYHERWREVRDADKFHRLASFGVGLGPLRTTVDDELARPGAMDRDKVLALVVRLLDETLIRVGNDEYATANQSYGLTTISSDHVDIDGREVRFTFVGKGGIDHEVAVHDARLARLVKRCHELDGQELFAWRAPDGRIVDVASNDVNEWLRGRMGDSVSAKDFRTWGATVAVAETLADAGPPSSEADARRQVLDAIDEAADLLGNTRDVCRTSYVHPRVPTAHVDGSLHECWSRSRRTISHRRAERTVLSLLDGAGRAPS
jgi:DNA topoisomerase-1